MATSPSRLAGSLERFHLDGIRDTGVTVGEGAYATVFQYDFRGLKCVGKKIHRLLYEHASPAHRAEMLRRFEEECELLGRLHHPNIVQFLGVHVETGSELPALVMEYLPTNLSSHLNRHGVPPDEISYSILRDVALGLRYLHEYSPPIVHRDLSANNVLLTASLSAKISDLGVAKILNITPSQMSQIMSTKAPGTPCYMPPEALIARPSYTKKIDSYSFGVMVLHIMSGEWPFPTDTFQRDPQSPGIYVPVTEVDRRAEFLQKMGTGHPLTGLVRQCLSNSPDERPESVDILQQIDTATSLVQFTATLVFRDLDDVDHEPGPDTQRMPSALDSEIQRLEIENQSLRKENRRLMAEIQRQGSDLRLHPGVKLRWNKCAPVPVEIVGAHIVVDGDNVYVGGGGTTARGSIHQAFQYNWKENVWSTLPRCAVKWFGMAHFMGKLITVGGVDLLNSPTCKVYALRRSQQWGEFLAPMPTARFFLSVATTSDSIIAAGGDTSVRSPAYTSIVEVYSSDTSQWYTVDPLPKPSIWMSPVTINDTCYLLGGKDQSNSAPKNCWSAFLPSLVQKAMSPTSHSESESVWSPLPPTPFCRSSAVCLSGSLMAVGGDGYDNTTRSTAVHAFLNSSWVRLNADLLAPRSLCSTAQLSQEKVIAVGGWDRQGYRSKTVFIGTIRS